VFVTSPNAVAASVDRGSTASKTALSMAARLFAVRMASHGVASTRCSRDHLTEMTAVEAARRLIARGRCGAEVGHAGRRATVRAWPPGSSAHGGQEVRVDGASC
jgi:hypothetical protein